MEDGMPVRKKLCKTVEAVSAQKRGIVGNENENYGD